MRTLAIAITLVSAATLLFMSCEGRKLLETNASPHRFEEEEDGGSGYAPDPDRSGALSPEAPGF